MAAQHKLIVTPDELKRPLPKDVASTAVRCLDLAILTRLINTVAYPISDDTKKQVIVDELADLFNTADVYMAIDTKVQQTAVDKVLKTHTMYLSGRANETVEDKQYYLTIDEAEYISHGYDCLILKLDAADKILAGFAEAATALYRDAVYAVPFYE